MLESAAGWFCMGIEVGDCNTETQEIALLDFDT
jgi:hypothetical protein